MGFILFILGMLLGAIGSYWYTGKKISELTERNHDKALVISLLKTRADESTKNTINKKENEKRNATK